MGFSDELQVTSAPLLLLYHADTCAAGFYLIRTDDKIGFAMVDRVRDINGDEKLTSRFESKFFISNEINFPI